MTSNDTKAATDATDSAEISHYGVAIESRPVNQEAIVTAYAACDTGDKARARAMIQHAIVTYGKTMATTDDMAVVQALIAAQDAQAVAKSAPTVTVDWDQRVAARVITLRSAAAMIQYGDVTPASVPDDVEIDLARVTAWIDLADSADVPDPDLYEASAKLAVAPIGGTRAAGGDVATHIIEALHEMPEGTVATVAMIRNAETSAYPEGAPRPASGGISNRLRKNQVEGDLAGVVTVDEEGSPLSARLA